MAQHVGGPSGMFYVKPGDVVRASKQTGNGIAPWFFPCNL